jgi:hypothetical protein
MMHTMFKQQESLAHRMQAHLSSVWPDVSKERLQPKAGWHLHSLQQGHADLLLFWVHAWHSSGILTS